MGTCSAVFLVSVNEVAVERVVRVDGHRAGEDFGVWQGGWLIIGISCATLRGLFLDCKRICIGVMALLQETRKILHSEQTMIG